MLLLTRLTLQLHVHVLYMSYILDQILLITIPRTSSTLQGYSGLVSLLND